MSSIMALKRKTKGPFRLTTPSTESNLPSLSDSESSLSSSAPSSPSSFSSDDSSTTSDDEMDTVHLADDTDGASALAPPATITEAIRRAKESGQYHPKEHYLVPPTPEQLSRARRQKPPRVQSFAQKLLGEKRKPALFVDEALMRREVNFDDVERNRWQGIQSVQVPEFPLRREEYVLDSREFKVVEVIGRVYKPSQRRRRAYEDNGIGIGIGGYIIRYADGHEFCIPIHKLDRFIERYPGLHELIEEFEHMSMAREDGDGEAIAYFKAQRWLWLRDEEHAAGELASALTTDTTKTEEAKSIFSGI